MKRAPHSHVWQSLESLFELLDSFLGTKSHRRGSQCRPGGCSYCRFNSAWLGREIITAIQQQHRGVIRVQENGCLALGMCADDDKVSLMEPGAGRQIITAMQEHKAFGALVSS
jgi:hypothetical protein